MTTFAAVTTGKGTGAISTIEVFGDNASTILQKIFQPTAKKQPAFEPGNICLGTITDAGQTIDQVTIGCEGKNHFAIHCHGNPLIVEMIMELLSKKKAKLLTYEQLMAKIYSADKTRSTIEIEAKIAQVKAKTLEGTRIIHNQIQDGLVATAKQWLQCKDKSEFKKIADEASQILRASKTAKLIANGCTIVLAGPANSGKSTLLNCLAGKQKAIVTDIKGTTRDWVSAECKIGRLAAEIIDTAGLDAQLLQINDDNIDKQAQQKSLEILQNADLVLLILDNSQSAKQLDETLFKKISDKKTLTVLNKSDLPAKLKPADLPEKLSETILINAKNSRGIDKLLKKIPQLLAVADFSTNQPICFTTRQEKLLQSLTKATSTQAAISAITELLNGQVCV